MVTAHEIAAQVRDPEMPMLTLADLGVLRGVDVDGERVVVRLTPTYSGCPAVAEMRADLIAALRRGGYDAVVRVELSPPWSTDDITEAGRRTLAEAGIAPPGPAPTGPVPVSLSATPVPTSAPAPQCPRCGSRHTEETSRFGPTACTSLWRCGDCLEPFEHVKAI